MSKTFELIGMDEFIQDLRTAPEKIRYQRLRKVIGAGARQLRTASRRNFDATVDRTGKKNYLKTRKGRVMETGVRAGSKVKTAGYATAFYNMRRSIDLFFSKRTNPKDYQYAVVGTRASKKHGAYYAQWQIGGPREYSGVRFKTGKRVFNGLDAMSDRVMISMGKAVDKELTRVLK